MTKNVHDISAHGSALWVRSSFALGGGLGLIMLSVIIQTLHFTSSQLPFFTKEEKNQISLYTKKWERLLKDEA